MPVFIDIIGQRFGRLTIVASGPRRIGKNGWLSDRTYACRCDCGGEKIVTVTQLTKGRTQSCGCLIHEMIGHNRTHGMSGTQIYRVWCAMRDRCYRPTDKSFKNYGGRGIWVCDRWLGKDGFANFLTDMGERPVHHSIERIDNDGPYSPENCQWIPRNQQSRNQRRGWQHQSRNEHGQFV